MSTTYERDRSRASWGGRRAARGRLGLAAVLLALGACTDRAAAEGADGADAGGSFEHDSPTDEGAVAGEHIRVFARYAEGVSLWVDFSTHPESSCADPFPNVVGDCAPVDTWFVSVRLGGGDAAVGVYDVADFEWEAEHAFETPVPGTCAGTSGPRGLLLDTVLTIEQAGADGVSGRVDELASPDSRHAPISGSFRAEPCR